MFRGDIPGQRGMCRDWVGLNLLRCVARELARESGSKLPGYTVDIQTEHYPRFEVIAGGFIWRK
jgi:hypothetical protein